MHVPEFSDFSNFEEHVKNVGTGHDSITVDVSADQHVFVGMCFERLSFPTEFLPQSHSL